MMVKQIVCINWGTKYGPPYINRLYAMVARNVTPPFRFVCFTDSDEGIRTEVECHPLPSLPVEIPKTKQGIWGKVRLFSRKLADLQGTALFLDLDILITGNLDDLFSYGDNNRVVIARNPVRPLERLGQSSVYRFPVGKLTPILEEFCANPKEVTESYVYEQRFLTQNAPGGAMFFPNRWIRHFRLQCMRTFPLNYFLQPKLPNAAKVVIFPGGLHPHHGIKGGWKHHREGISKTEHLLGYPRLKYREENFLSYLQHYIMPTDWIEDTWRE